MMDRRGAPPPANWDQGGPLNPARPPLTQPSNIPRESLAHKDAVPRDVKRIAKSRLQLPLPCQLPGLLDPVAIDSDEMALYEDDSPCAPKKPQKARRPNDYRVYSRPRDIPKLDYGLPGDFGKGARS